MCPCHHPSGHSRASRLGLRHVVKPQSGTTHLASWHSVGSNGKWWGLDMTAPNRNHDLETCFSHSNNHLAHSRESDNPQPNKFGNSSLSSGKAHWKDFYRPKGFQGIKACLVNSQVANCVYILCAIALEIRANVLLLLGPDVPLTDLSPITCSL